ncbi:hypothetical protein GQ457_15G015390 [Hibiscus cannabinus]
MLGGDFTLFSVWRNVRVGHREELVSEPRAVSSPEFCGGFRQLSEREGLSRIRPVSMDEVHLVVFEMDPMKSPGVDGYNAGIFQKNWDTVGTSVFKFVYKFFESVNLEDVSNHTLLFLHPNVANPGDIKQFRPISLCSVLYKVITKILVNRLKPFLPGWVHLTQASFVLGRHITDNIILAQECLNWSHRVSVSKSHIFFSKNHSSELKNLIGGFFGFEIGDDLGKYVGVPLLHKQVMKGTYRFFIDKVEQRLSGLATSTLSFASRVTLTKAVLQAIPTYVMQISYLKKGGLGFRDLHNNSKALLMKIGFALVSNEDKLWVRVLKAKYKWEGVLPKDILKPNCSWLWKGLGQIVCVVPLHATFGSDKSGLRWEETRVFTTPSAYQAISGNFSSPHPNLWWVVWKLNVPQRVWVFLWLMEHNTLLTNVELSRHHLINEVMCPAFGQGEETLDHVFRSCN